MERVRSGVFRRDWLTVVMFIAISGIFLSQCSDSAEETPKPPFCYVACQDGGLSIVSVADPMNPSVSGTIAEIEPEGPIAVYDVVVDGTIAYCAAGFTGVLVLDVSDPSKPTRKAVLDTPGSAIAVYLDGSTLYIADTKPAIIIIDVFLPNIPVEMGSLEFDENEFGVFSDIVASGSIIVVPDTTGQIVFVTALDPTDPELLGVFPDVTDPISCALLGDNLLVADQANGMVVIDISDPTEPVRIGGYNTNGSTLDIALSGSTAFLADGNNGLLTLDLSDPAEPHALGVLMPGYIVYGVKISASRAYLTCGGNGLVVAEVSNPASMQQEGTSDTPGFALRSTIGS